MTTFAGMADKDEPIGRPKICLYVDDTLICLPENIYVTGLNLLISTSN